MTLSKLESMPLESKNYGSSINSLIISKDFISAFWESESLKTKLNDSLYALKPYKNLVDYRFDLIQFLQDVLDESYKNTILGRTRSNQRLPSNMNSRAHSSQMSSRKSSTSFWSHGCCS